MNSELDRHIEINSSVRNGQPCLAGSRISIADLVLMHLKLGQSLLEIASKYNLSISAVYAGIAYYYDHRNEIDSRIESDNAFVEAFKHGNPSPLQKKLKALTGVETDKVSS